MTDDDTKFERARREAPTRWTAAIVKARPTLNKDTEAHVEGDPNEPEVAENDVGPAQGGAERPMDTDQKVRPTADS